MVIKDIALTDKMFIDDEFDIALQELDLLFGTTNTELIGDPAYGTSFEQFLWQLTPNKESLQQYIYEKIQTMCVFVMKYDYSIDIEVLEDYDGVGTYKVNINIRNPKDNTKVTKVYNYSR